MVTRFLVLAATALTSSSQSLPVFAGRRFLPLSLTHNGVDVRTKTGATRVELAPLTLAEKTVFFEERIRRRYNWWLTPISPPWALF